MKTTFYIYSLRCTVTDQEYIGATKDLYVRRKAHLSRLKAGQHANVFLQRSYNFFGEGCFQFKIIDKALGKRAKEIKEYAQVHFGFGRFNVTYSSEDALQLPSWKNLAHIHESNLRFETSVERYQFEFAIKKYSKILSSKYQRHLSPADTIRMIVEKSLVNEGLLDARKY